MMNTQIDFTIAIPTYNGATRLPELLTRLQNQIHTENINWEIIIVDNNSNDDTAKIIQNYQANWPYSFPLKYIFEPKQGAGYARKRAVQEARGKYIGFLDDDNYPESTWIKNAYEFGEKYPQTGAFASQIHPQWEVEPPENFQRIAPFLAITERGNQALLYSPKSKLLPPSAGLVVRRQAWLESIPKNSILNGRIAGNTLTSEDLEMLGYMQKSGWEIWYNPAMEIYHQIPAWRLTREYLIPFFRGIGLSRYVTRMIDVKVILRPLVYILYVINDVRKILIHLWKYGLVINTDLVAACELQLYISSLMSPFYLWSHGYFKKSSS